MIKSEIELSHLFAYIDRDNSKSISIEEFTKGLKTVLNDEECRTLFLHIDTDNSNSLSYEEIINSLQHIYTGYILFKLRGMIDKSAGVLTPEIIFNTSDNDNDGLIDIIEFFELMQL
jgi:Ca2+-binding EF-hand superfamily protein